ncbi:mechanosensitive ion channel domain-containing protein [Jiella sp. M17.18]|uniref:mechanosensitive ion channel domain-containing protein n=1 Tax=Jiella sp. M17.18 TaxID=3234247 RepID=UPI0034DFCDCC
MHFFIPSRVADHITLTLVLLASAFVLRWIGELLLTRLSDPALLRRRRFTLRTVCNMVLAVALLAIWLSEIHDMLLSLTAVIVAMVVAAKELIMCAAGSMLRLSGHLFKVGDRIEFAGIHGEVMDHGLFSTTIMELPSTHHGHAGTGRTVMLPNSVFLTGAVRVEAQPRHYAPHRFTLTLETPVPPRDAVEAIEAAAEATLSADRDLAARFHQFAARKSGVEIAGPATEVMVGTTEFGKLQFHVVIYCLVKDARAHEQAITLEALSALGIGAAAPKPAEARAWAEIARQLRESAGKARDVAAA